MNLHRRAGVVVVALTVVFAACDSDGITTHAGNPMSPSGFGEPAPFAGTSRLVPAEIGFTSVPTFNCPFIAPFTSNFSLVINQRSGSETFLDRVAFRFVDGLGLPSPINLTRSDLTGMFGSTLIPSGTTRTFLFRPQFGCGFTSTPDSLFVTLVFLDGFGRTHQSTLTAFITLR